MPKFKVTYMPSTGKPTIEVEAADFSGISDYTVQFYDDKGRTDRLIGGVAEVVRIDESSPSELLTVNTEGKPADVPTAAAIPGTPSEPAPEPEPTKDAESDGTGPLT